MYKVYIYTNIVNNKKYCGITNRTLHKRSEGNGYGYIRTEYKSKTRFANAILKYGWENFKPEVLYEVKTVEEAMDLEIKTIAELKLIDPDYGYNLHFGGTRVNPEHCSRKGEQNGMFGKGYKLQGDKNGRALKVEMILDDGSKTIFNTQKECRDFLKIDKTTMITIKNNDGPYFLRKGKFRDCNILVEINVIDK